MPYLDTFNKVWKRMKHFAPRTSTPAVVLSQSFRTFDKPALPFPPDSHIQNDFRSLAEQVLKLFPKPNSLWQSLRQRWRYEITTAGVAGQQWGSKGIQRLCKLPERLKRCWGSVLVPRAPIYPKNHPFWGDKLVPQWSSCKILQNWQDLSAD